MRALSIVFLSMFCLLGFSQTKLIAFKSHSGKNENFKIALENNLFDIENSNLGNAPNRYEKNAVLDSVIYVSDGKIILVTSKICTEYDRNHDSIIDSRKWNAGKEEFYNHPLFSKIHSLDSIKEVLKEQYFFKNDMDKVVFIGFDNGVKKIKHDKKDKKKSEMPFVNSDAKFPSKPILILFLLFFSSIIAFFSWKTTTFKNKVIS